MNSDNLKKVIARLPKRMQAKLSIDDSICKVDGHYQMALLLKENNPALLYNCALGKARLQHLTFNLTQTWRQSKEL